LVLIAKQRGLIPAARPILLQLRQGGMFLADKVMDQALALVNE
jgi:predicted nucleic acid-binding protein